MQAVLIVTIVGLVAFAAGNPVCLCTMEYMPVCGLDGKTYGNQCEIECNGVELAYEGECKATSSSEHACICTMEYNPVCGTDGHTYGNQCALKCNGTELAHEGECKEIVPIVNEAEDHPCICTFIYQPVCGLDGQTYGNMCSMECFQVNLAHLGECGTIND